MAAKQLSDGGSDGTVMGQSADDLLGFYGNETPVAQMTYSGAISGASLTSLTILSGGSNYGFSSSAQMLQVTAFLTAVRNTLVNMGIWPSTTV